jgi:hypothetical protein
MNNGHPARIIDVDQLGNGAVVSFEDGRSGFYSAALLSEIFSRARDMNAEAKMKGMDLPE